PPARRPSARRRGRRRRWKRKGTLPSLRTRTAHRLLREPCPTPGIRWSSRGRPRGGPAVVAGSIRLEARHDPAGPPSLSAPRTGSSVPLDGHSRPFPFRNVGLGVVGIARASKCDNHRMVTSERRWFDRAFSFDLPVTQAPNVVERLRGTPARLEELCRGV